MKWAVLRTELVFKDWLYMENVDTVPGLSTF